MGWNRGDSRIFIADAECRTLDVGRIPGNKFQTHGNIDFILPVGAGTSPSDK